MLVFHMELPIQLPTYGLGKAAEQGPNPEAPVPTREGQRKLLVPSSALVL